MGQVSAPSVAMKRMSLLGLEFDFVIEMPDLRCRARMKGK